MTGKGDSWGKKSNKSHHASGKAPWIYIQYHHVELLTLRPTAHQWVLVHLYWERRTSCSLANRSHLDSTAKKVMEPQVIWQHSSAIDALSPKHLLCKPTFSSPTRQASYLIQPFTESLCKQLPSQRNNSGYEETFVSFRVPLTIW